VDPFVFGVDLDGVCGDYTAAFRTIVASELGVSEDALPEARSWDFHEWNLDAAGGFERLHALAVTEHRMFATMPPIEGVADALWRLSDAGVGVAAVISIALALFAGSAAVGNLLSALSAVFDRTEKRTWLKKRLMALSLLFGTVVALAAMVALMAVVPEVLRDWDGNRVVEVLIDVGRFLGLGLLMAVGLSVLYRVGPAPIRSETYELVPGGRRALVSIGAIIATVLFVLLSWGFGVFARNFGSYNETYGALAGIIVVLLWLQLASLAVLIGAEIDALRQHRKVRAARVAAGLTP
jgi:YihY family inner membrane protein